ncbi:PREDICTED: protein FAM221B [Condylura cristata]|uniref:protein FAM221B n=1 Tax=Condylura cristata TaxID=143302 RepID=UPI000643B5C8|nr:PREDICTED: protein FAM221B [Condylura cristata]
MEADQVTEKPHSTVDAPELTSSKDPSAEDFQDLSTSAAILESSIPEAPLVALISESHLVPSPSPLTPLEIHPSAAILESSISETPLEHSTSEFPLETHIPQVPEENFIIQASAQSHSSVPSSNYRKEDFVSPSSSSEVPGTRRDFQISDDEAPQQHTISGSSAQIQLDASAEQREEEKEDEKGIDVTDSTAQPERQLGYPAQPVVPATQGELVEVAKAMPREKFGAQVQYRFQWEKNTALCAIQTGLYIGWRCPHYLWDCFRIGDESKCFCGHLLKEHRIISDISVPCNIGQCRCLMFCFIPSRPEEVGEFWLKRRATFDPKAWRAQCRCKHSHEDHAATGSHPCRIKGCCCNCFESNFLCAACDRRWEEHETFFETEETRRRGGRPHGTSVVNTWRRPL